MKRADVAAFAEKLGYSEAMTKDLLYCFDEGARDERESCAKLISDIGDDYEAAGYAEKVWACDYLEDAIRARSNA